MMTISELNNQCILSVFSEEIMLSSEPFSCGDTEEQRDLNEFFAKDAIIYQKRLLGKSYIFRLRSNPRKIVAAFTVANDSIRLTNKLPEENRDLFLEYTDLKDKSIKRFPGVLLGRLATNSEFAGKGFGSAVMDFIKSMFFIDNRTGCRFIIVDALNNDDTIRYYNRNGFKFLIDDEKLEAKYIGIGVGHLPLRTRLMYYDLLNLVVEQ